MRLKVNIAAVSIPLREREGDRETERQNKRGREKRVFEGERPVC